MNKHPKFSLDFLMIGFPNENLSQINDTIKMAIEAQLDWYTVNYCLHQLKYMMKWLQLEKER